jgi:hypothetical protein
MSGPGTNHAKPEQLGFLVSSGTELNRLSGPIPDRWGVTRTRCEH